MLTALFDIDGTIAKIDHRRPLVVGKKADWKTFNSLMGDDLPNEPIVDLYRALWESKSYELILVSGRGEEFRSVTETWLTWNLIPFGKLLMRPQGDFRSDVEIKQEILDRLLSEGKTISFVVDDRDSVVEMWRRNNITCLQCDKGNF
jgi:hypothetical protein